MHACKRPFTNRTRRARGSARQEELVQRKKGILADLVLQREVGKVTSFDVNREKATDIQNAVGRNSLQAQADATNR